MAYSTGGSKKTVTLKDIALKTGFSINTVSHALKNCEDISTATRELIQKVAKEMGYIGNASARYLRSGVSKTIAIIIGDISNPHFAIIVKELETYLQKQGYVSFVLNTDENAEVERQVIIAAIEKNVDGIIICPTPGGEDNIQFLQNMYLPLVLIGRHFENLHTNFVVCDDIQGGYLATKYLLEQEHRKILFLNGDIRISSSKERLSGYQKALKEFGVEFDPDYVREIPITMDKSVDRLDKILKLNKFTAILAFSDMIAWEVIYTLNQKGYSIPKDFSVIGFDNIQSKFYFPVQLTTITSSKITMSQKAADLLLRQIEDRCLPPIGEILESRLIVRETTKPNTI